MPKYLVHSHRSIDPEEVEHISVVGGGALLVWFSATTDPNAMPDLVIAPGEWTIAEKLSPPESFS